MIGIRANWTCAQCATTAVSHHIEEIQAARDHDGKAAVLIYPPTGWTVRDNDALCPGHSPKPKPTFRFGPFGA